MSPIDVMRTRSMFNPSGVTMTDRLAVGFGLAATGFFVSWVLASILRETSLVEPLFSAFFLSMLVVIGLTEHRLTQARRISRNWFRQS